VTRGRYYLQNRLQDTNWEDLGESYGLCGDAICRASELAETNMLVGMTRVVDSDTGKVGVTYAAGGGLAGN
jgi:hypothetical protein